MNNFFISRSRSLAIIIMVLFLGGFLLPLQAQAVPIVQTFDFINDGTRSHFNGFESIPNNGADYTGGGGPYIEDTIQVQQINGDSGNDIWVTYGWAGRAGAFSWYPNGGDQGYTQLSLAGGIDFVDVGFNYGSGSSASSILYEVLNDSMVVLSGMAPLTTSVNYLGFSGGGFDTIRLRDTRSNPFGSVTDGSYQSLALDNIETQGSPVPEPATMLLLGSGLLGLAGFRRKFKKR